MSLFFVLAFNRQKSMQNRRVPSFFCTNTMALHQGDCDGLITPPSSISCTCHRTSSTSCGAIRQNLSLKGSSCPGNSSIMCSMASVTPISPSSRQNTWWNSMRRRLAFKAFLADHPSSLPRLPFLSSTSIKSFWHSSVVSGFGLSLSSSANFFSNSGNIIASGTALAATILLMSLPLARCIGFPVPFLNTVDTLWLPSFKSV